MPLPHEPVSYRWMFHVGLNGPEHRWEFDEGRWDSKERIFDLFDRDAMRVTLANGQRIIVRAKL